MHGAKEETMKVQELMSSKGKAVVSMDAGKSVEDAIRIMHDNKISAVIVNEHDKTTGIFTERDVVRCYLATNGKSFKEIPVRDAMTRDLVVAELGDDLNDIMAVMVEKNIRHLPVISEGKITGMLSVRDVVLNQVSKITTEIHYLRNYISSY
jgi:IMP dehydrogenase